MNETYEERQSRLVEHSFRDKSSAVDRAWYRQKKKMKKLSAEILRRKKNLEKLRAAK